jgi:D-glycero-D-manno-heptose 1,7-bisphosphate phosphatase
MVEAVFLDRDGVLNRGFVKDGKSYAPRSIKEFRLLPYAAVSVKKLREAGYLVIVVTNQPDINNGLITRETVDEMHLKLKNKTLVNDIFLCPHSRKENCNCRKPKSGMLIEASQKYNINLKKSFMIGDRASDIAAGIEAGCRTIFINRRYNETAPLNQEITFFSIKSATNYIIKQDKQ